MNSSLLSLVKRNRPSVVRVFVHDEDVGNPVAGTGFFIDEHTILTCAHTLLLTTNIRSLVESLPEGNDKEVTLQKFYETHVKKVEIQKDTGEMEEALSVRFHGANDIAIITVASTNVGLPVSKTKISEGSEIFYCGYPKDFDMPKTEWPFSVLRGIVSSFVRSQVGGYDENALYQLQISMLGGASGASVFSAEDGGLVGMLNGYRSWGNDGFMRKDDENDEPVLDNLYVPLPLAVATPIEVALKTVKTLQV